MDLVKALNSQYMKEELPEAKVGDTVRVHVRIKEGSRERIQVSKAPSSPVSTAVSARPSLSVVFPTAWAARRSSPCILPTLL